jgi:hypothetical protein
MTSDEEDILKLSLSELRSRYNMVTSIHDKLRNRVLSLLTIGVAFSGFTYASINQLKDLDFADWTLVILSSAPLIVMFILIVIIMLSSKWRAPMDLRLIPQARNIHQTKARYLSYIESEYIGALAFNQNIVARNGKLFNASIFLLVFSVIIIMVIRGGNNL